MQISLYLLQTVPKCYINIQYTVKNSLFLYISTPSSSKFAMETFMKFDWLYSVKQWLTLLIEDTQFLQDWRLAQENCSGATEQTLMKKCPLLKNDIWIFLREDMRVKSFPFFPKARESCIMYRVTRVSTLVFRINVLHAY